MASILGGPCGSAKLVMLRDTLFVEGDHSACDLGQRVLDREMARIQPMHLGVRQCLQIRLAAFRREEDIVLAPEDDRPWLPFPQKRLPLG